MDTTTSTDLSTTAMAFFDACETGKGWDVCKDYCHDSATFSCQSAALADVEALSEYCEWMKGLFGPIPSASYDMLAFATDEARNCVVAAAVFKGTNTGDGGPVAPTGKSTASDYAYIIEFEAGKVSRMTKIWNDGFALTELGWM